MNDIEPTPINAGTGSLTIGFPRAEEEKKKNSGAGGILFFFFRALVFSGFYGVLWFLFRWIFPDSGIVVFAIAVLGPIYALFWEIQDRLDKLEKK